MDHYILVMGLTEPNRSVVPDNKIDCLLAYQKIPVPIAEGKHESIFVSSSNEWRPGIIGCFWVENPIMQSQILAANQNFISVLFAKKKNKSIGQLCTVAFAELY